MNEKNLEKVKKMAIEAGYDDVTLLGKWKGFVVFEPIYDDNETHYTGYPQFILSNYAELRWTNDYKESLEIMKKIFSPKV